MKIKQLMTAEAKKSYTKTMRKLNKQLGFGFSASFRASLCRLGTRYIEAIEKRNSIEKQGLIDEYSRNVINLGAEELRMNNI